LELIISVNTAVNPDMQLSTGFFNDDPQTNSPNSVLPNLTPWFDFKAQTVGEADAPQVQGDHHTV
jgi:hypothetical protein